MLLYDLYNYLTNLQSWHVLALLLVVYTVYYLIEVVKVSDFYIRIIKFVSNIKFLKRIQAKFSHSAVFIPFESSAVLMENFILICSDRFLLLIMDRLRNSC